MELSCHDTSRSLEQELPSTQKTREEIFLAGARPGLGTSRVVTSAGVIHIGQGPSYQKALGWEWQG